MKYLAALIRRFVERRDIFTYWNGRRYRKADPFAIYRGLATHPTFDWEADPPMLSVPDIDAVLEASLKIATAIRDVFDIPPVDQGGLTERECADLLKQYCAYQYAVKKNIKPSPTPSVPTAEATSESATRPNSGSTSTENVKTSDSPTTSPSVAIGP